MSGQFSSWSIYEELLGQYKNFLPPQSDCFMCHAFHGM